MQRTSRRRSRITLERQVPSHVPLVTADRAKVRQVLVNPIENAVKYSPEEDPDLLFLRDAEAELVSRMGGDLGGIEGGRGLDVPDRAPGRARLVRAAAARARARTP